MDAPPSVQQHAQHHHVTWQDNSPEGVLNAAWEQQQRQQQSISATSSSTTNPPPASTPLFGAAPQSAAAVERTSSSPVGPGYGVVAATGGSHSCPGSVAADVRSTSSESGLSHMMRRAATLTSAISFRDLRISMHDAPSTACLMQLDSTHDSRHGAPPSSRPHTQTAESVLPAGAGRGRVAVEQKKLAIIMVGLPGRGKTFVCNKLKCYLNWCGARIASSRLARGCRMRSQCTSSPVWASVALSAAHVCLLPTLMLWCPRCCRLGHKTEHFNVGQYRRKLKDGDCIQVRGGCWSEPLTLSG